MIKNSMIKKRYIGILGIVTVVASVAALGAWASSSSQFHTTNHKSTLTTAQTPQSESHGEPIAPSHKSEPKNAIEKVLFIGDSMTGWLAERLNAYGEQNGFEVATVVWDGSTIAKWGASPKLKSIIAEQKPDAIFVSLGMNELFERNPETRLGKQVDTILESFGDIPYLWVGPPSWPGKPSGDKMNEWLEKKAGEGNFYNSSALKLARQSASNPHPTREGMIKWMDSVLKWLPENNSTLYFESLTPPPASKMTRGKTFIYKKMKETL